MRFQNTNRAALFFFAAIYLAFCPGYAYPAAYEASTLHNTVSRSETVQGLFAERWKAILSDDPFFDLYGRINWVPGFKINTTTMTGEKRSVPMTLVRTYGSMSLIYRTGDSQESGRSMPWAGHSASQEPVQPEGRTEGLGFGFTVTGFHYGLTRQTAINRGHAGSESVTDYKYTQFFDDIFALSLLYSPFFHVHGGVILNNQIEPNDDGTMSYTNSSDLNTRRFVSSELFDFLTTTATLFGGEMETLSLEIAATELASLFTGPISPEIPRLTLILKKTALYNDMPYDSVWVHSSTGRDGMTKKTSNLSESLKERAALYTLGLLVEERWRERWLFDLYAEWQRPTKRLISKMTEKQIEVSPFRELRASAGYDFLAGSKGDQSMLKLIFSLGLSRYWDTAAPLHREQGSGYVLYGGFGSLKLDAQWIGMELRVSYNHSEELRRLMECAGKAVLEGSFFVSF